MEPLILVSESNQSLIQIGFEYMYVSQLFALLFKGCVVVLAILCMWLKNLVRLAAV